MLGIDTQGRFLLGDADQAGIEADIIPDLCKASENDIIRSEPHPDLRGRCLIETHRPLFIEGPFHNGSFHDDDFPLHGNSGGEDVIDPFPEIIQILLAINHKGKNSHFIDLAGISGLSDRRRRKGKNKGEK
jgi:hypothetical protein